MEKETSRKDKQVASVPKHARSKYLARPAKIQDLKHWIKINSHERLYAALVKKYSKQLHLSCWH